MNYRNILTFVVRLLVGIILILLIWYPFVTIAFVFGQGQDPEFAFGDNHKLQRVS